MRFVPDVLVQDHSNKPLAVVEIKNRGDLSPDLAEALRRTWIDDYGLDPAVPYLILVSQEQGFVWAGAPSRGDRLAAQFPMGLVVTRYVPELEPGGWLRHEELRLVVLQWIYDMIDGKVGTEEEPERAIAPTGLIQSLRGANVAQEVPV